MTKYFGGGEKFCVSFPNAVQVPESTGCRGDSAAENLSPGRRHAAGQAGPAGAVAPELNGTTGETPPAASESRNGGSAPGGGKGTWFWGGVEG